MPSMRLVLSLTAGIVAAGSLVASSAMGAAGFYLYVTNELQINGAPAGYPKVRAFKRTSADRGYRPDDCWNMDSLDDAGFAGAAPGQRVLQYSERSAAFFSGCHNSTAHLDFTIQVDEGDGRGWIPLDPGSRQRLQHGNSSHSMEGMLQTWVPRPLDGRGIVCWDVTNFRITDPRNSTYTQTANANLVVRGGALCNRPTNESVRWDRFKGVGTPDARTDPGPPIAGPPPRPARAPRRAQAQAQNQSGVGEAYDVLTMSHAACAWLRGTTPQNAPACNDVINPDNWNLNELATEVRNFRVVGAGTRDGKTVEFTPQKMPVCETKKYVEPGQRPGQVDCSITISGSNTRQTATQTGLKFGTKASQKFGFKGGVFFTGKVETNFEQSFEWNYAKTETESQTQGVTISVRDRQPAAAGKTTYFTVYAYEGSSRFYYEADLTLGGNTSVPRPLPDGTPVVDGDLSPVTSPAFNALGISPMANQPCMAVIIGPRESRNTMLAVRKQMEDAGIQPGGRNSEAWQTALMLGAGSFTPSTKSCPGFPTSLGGFIYPSSASFKGTGFATIAGADEKGAPRQAWANANGVLPNGSGSASISTESCTWVEPPDPNPTPSPCGPGNQGNYASPAAKRSTYGAGAQRVDLRNGTGPQEVTTNDGDDTVNASNDGDTIRTGADDDTVEGGAGPDRVYAGTGSDQVRSGAGPDLINVRGGAGTETFIDSGAGDDRVEVARTARGLVSTGPGNDQVSVVQSGAALVINAGPGNDVYRVSDHGQVPGVLEAPGEGRDTLYTARSTEVPRGLEKLVGTGRMGLTLRGIDGPQDIIGGLGDDRISGGAGIDRLDGQDGADRLFLNPDAGIDTATGGPEGDRFVPLGTPVTAPRAQTPAVRLAHVITDFDAAQGDRVVMRPSVFGTEIRGLGTGAVFVGRLGDRTGGRASLLIDPATGLVTFDRDGDGPLTDKVVVILRGYSSIPAAGFVTG